jgi:RNA polymerase sigma-70 factor (ECF subfamily)
MSEIDFSKPATPHSDAPFATTHWTVVLAAGSPDSSRYREALDALCQAYWFPLYAYLRRRGYEVHQAEDYTQAFFTRLLEKDTLKRADPARGRFRTFLLVSLKNFVAGEWDRARALKRGGRWHAVPFDIQEAETRYAAETAADVSAEKLFERSWALTVLQRAFIQLQAEYGQADRAPLFDALKVRLSGDQDATPYREVAATLGMTEVAVSAAAHRLRQRYRELVRREIAQTVNTSEQVDDEVRALFAALGD